MEGERTLCLTLLVLLTSTLFYANGVEIEIDQGFLLGKEEQSYEGRNFFAFKSIPFAEPPVGEQRFQSPRPYTEWEGVFDATEFRDVCAQAALGFDEGSEDCLYLSVYTPKLPVSGGIADLPVLVWLHGGSFVTGGAKDYNPYLLMDKDIVLVIPQYRLGILGYYTSHSHSAPGNYGALDQVVALKWVQKNIAKFGGDPNHVTLGGDCAGGVSSVLHMMSPLSQGLFERVISFSGSPLSYWTIHPRHNRFGLLMAKNVKCPPYDADLLTQCFRERTAEELLLIQRDILEARDLLVGNHKLAPAIQIAANSHVSNLFLEEHPFKLLLKGDYAKVPVLLSVTRDVGSYLVDMALYDFVKMRLEDKSNLLEELIPMLVKEIDILDHENKQQIFKKFYLPQWDYKNLDEALPGLAQMLGDGVFNSAILTLAKILSKEVDTRLFRFEYEGGPKLFDIRHEGRDSAPPIPSSSVSHGDELFFFLPFDKFNMTEEQKDVVDQMLNMFDDFVNGREPLQTWPLFTSEGLETTILTSDGTIKKDVRFTNKNHENLLQYIFENQHEKILETIEKEQEIDISEWKHDEL